MVVLQAHTSHRGFCKIGIIIRDFDLFIEELVCNFAS